MRDLRSMTAMTLAPRRRVLGFTYIGVLLAVALVGAGLAALGESWHTNVQRSREAELQFVGEQFKRAIKLYYDGTPGGAKQLPKTLEDLVHDARYPVVRRYLRKVYADPMRGKVEWGLIRQTGSEGIVGVHSLSEDTPFKGREAASGAPRRPRYADWRFMADIELAPTSASAVVQTPGVQPQLAAPSPAPEAAPPPEAQAAAAQPPTPRPKPPTDRCERLKASDARTCASSQARLGQPDANCESSAAARYANCVSGLPAGPLWVQ